MISIRTWNTRGTEPVISGRRLLDNTRYNQTISTADDDRYRGAIYRRRQRTALGPLAVMKGAVWLDYEDSYTTLLLHATISMRARC
jgi:hypothetical protein